MPRRPQPAILPQQSFGLAHREPRRSWFCRTEINAVHAKGAEELREPTRCQAVPAAAFEARDRGLVDTGDALEVDLAPASEESQAERCSADASQGRIRRQDRRPDPFRGTTPKFICQLMRTPWVPTPAVRDEPPITAALTDWQAILGDCIGALLRLIGGPIRLAPHPAAHAPYATIGIRPMGVSREWRLCARTRPRTPTDFAATTLDLCEIRTPAPARCEGIRELTPLFGGAYPPPSGSGPLRERTRRRAPPEESPAAWLTSQYDSSS